METFTVPRGTYYLGDPCYSFSDSWENILNDSSYFDRPYKRDNKVVVAFSTAFGDGTYKDQFGNEYPVDAGLIGLVHVDLAERTPTGVHTVHFNKSTICTKDGGTLTFGDRIIETDDLEENENE